MNLKKGILISLFLLLAGGIAYSQVVTGSLWGKVTDETGAVLLGILVELSSPSFIGGFTPPTLRRRASAASPLCHLHSTG